MTAFRESRMLLSLLASANRWKLALFALLGFGNRPGRGKRLPKGAGHSENTVQSSKELDIMNQINLQNRLEVANGTVKNEPNNAMQPASQTTENGQAEKKSPLNRIGLFAILAVGADAAASFLKSKMEKAAAVAFKVGAAILKAKQAASAAAAAVFVGIRPEPTKKARLASISLFALLAAFFIASPNGMATPRGIWLPEYEEQHTRQTVSNGITIRIPGYGTWKLPPDGPVITTYSSRSKVLNPATEANYGTVDKVRSDNTGKITSTEYTYYSTRTESLSYFSYIDPTGSWRNVTYTNSGLNLVYHTDVGEYTNERSVAFYVRNGVRYISTGPMVTEWLVTKYREKRDLLLFFPKTAAMEGGPFDFDVFFNVWNEDLPDDDPNCSGTWKTAGLFAYPGPWDIFGPGVPSNMNKPTNGFLSCSYWTQYVPSSGDSEDDDDE